MKLVEKTESNGQKTYRKLLLRDQRGLSKAQEALNNT